MWQQCSSIVNSSYIIRSFVYSIYRVILILIFISVVSTNKTCKTRCWTNVTMQSYCLFKFLRSAAVIWCINGVSLSGCVKLTVAVRAGGTAGTKETVATAVVTEAEAEVATTAVVVVVAVAAAMTAVVAMTVAAEADLPVWGKLRCATAPLRYLNVVWKMCVIL